MTAPAEARMLPAEPGAGQPVFDATVNIACADYSGHRFEHVRDGAGWRCPICEPGGEP